MTVSDFYAVLDERFPRSLSLDWDNDGVMCCADRDREVNKVLVSLDATQAAIAEAARRGCDVLLTHHPMIFRPLRAVEDGLFPGRRVIAALASGVTVISLHTRLDAADGGVNDCLVGALGFKNAGKFGPDDCPSLGRYFDLAEPTSAAALAALCRDRLGSKAVRLTGEGVVRRVCAVGGEGGDFIAPAISLGAQLLVTGECSYNDAQDAAERGLIVLEAGHFETEVPVCARLGSICGELGIETEYFDSRSFTLI